MNSFTHLLVLRSGTFTLTLILFSECSGRYLPDLEHCKNDPRLCKSCQQTRLLTLPAVIEISSRILDPAPCPTLRDTFHAMNPLGARSNGRTRAHPSTTLWTFANSTRTLWWLYDDTKLAKSQCAYLPVSKYLNLPPGPIFASSSASNKSV